jgi:hypothetical protein
VILEKVSKKKLEIERQNGTVESLNGAKYKMQKNSRMNLLSEHLGK